MRMAPYWLQSGCEMWSDDVDALCTVSKREKIHQEEKKVSLPTPPSERTTRETKMKKRKIRREDLFFFTTQTLGPPVS